MQLATQEQPAHSEGRNCSSPHSNT